MAGQPTAGPVIEARTWALESVIEKIGITAGSNSGQPIFGRKSKFKLEPRFQNRKGLLPSETRSRGRLELTFSVPAKIAASPCLTRIEARSSVQFAEISARR